MNYLLLLFLVACCARPLHAQTEHAVSPATADPANGNPAPNNLHFAYVNPASTPRNRLVLFFPGTGGVAANYRLWVKHAANLGFHAISLTYPNAVAVNALCSNVADSTCHSRARLETFDGQDRHAGLAVDTLNCIRRRTLKLLQYLSATYPAENWGQYYRGNTILWSRIVVSGHSQGGGYAGLIAKLVPVDRVVQLAATDWVAPLGRLADWITWVVTDDIPLVALCYYPPLLERNSLGRKLYEEFEQDSEALPEPLRSHTQAVNKFFAEQFAKPSHLFSSHQEYIFSALFAERVVEQGLAGVYFPSVKAEGLGYNVAISPDYADRCLCLDAVLECSLHQDGKRFMLDNNAFTLVEPRQQQFALGPVPNAT